MSGICGVMPCKPEWNNIKILRRDESDITAGIYPSQGAFRHQQGGLLSPKNISYKSTINSKSR